MTTAPSVNRRRGIRNRLTENRVAPYLYVAPFFIVFVVFGLFPVIYNGWIALHDWNPLRPGRFIGIDNFSRLADDPRFWNALKNTISILILSAVPQTLLSLGLAFLLNEALLRARTFFRMSLLVPIVTSTIAVGVVFTSIFGRDFGVMNSALSLVGVDRIDWQRGILSHIAIATMVVWRWTGYTTLIFLAAMQAIPRELYEVAALDGASRYRQLRDITVPLIRPTLVFMLIVTTIGGLQIFAEPLIFGGASLGVTGGSNRQFQTVVEFLYEQGFVNFKFGYGAAISWALFGVILIFSLANLVLVRRTARQSMG